MYTHYSQVSLALVSLEVSVLALSSRHVVSGGNLSTRGYTTDQKRQCKAAIEQEDFVAENAQLCSTHT